MSSKFKPSTTGTAKPDWCKASLFPAHPQGDPALPDRITCFAIWADHDPLAYVHLSESFLLNRQGTGALYTGESAATKPRLTVRAERLTADGPWVVTLKVYDDFRNPETLEFDPIAADPANPLTIRPAPVIAIPANDWQEVSIVS